MLTDASRDTLEVDGWRYSDEKIEDRGYSKLQFEDEVEERL
jgi:hypothetical protein